MAGIDRRIATAHTSAPMTPWEVCSGTPSQSIELLPTMVLMCSGRSTSLSGVSSSGLPLRAICSSTGSRSFMLLIFFSWIRMYGSSSTHSMRSASLTK